MKFDETMVREEFAKKREEGKIPERTLETLELYVWRGLPTGGFLRAFLANDLQGAIGRADSRNFAAFKELAQLIHWGLPIGSHGSYERVDEWGETMRSNDDDH